MKRPIKVKAHENLSPANIEKVIKLLTPEEGVKPITKKAACEILNITYNTTRLDSIINAHVAEKERYQKRRLALKGTPLADHEVANITESVLLGEPLEKIAKETYRSTTIIKKAVEDIGIPGYSDEDSFGLFPEICMQDSFETEVRDAENKIIKEGEVAYFPKLDCLVTVIKQITTDYAASQAGMSNYDYDSEALKLYRVHSRNNGYCHAYSGALASLKHLEKYGVNFNKLKNVEKYVKPNSSKD